MTQKKPRVIEQTIHRTSYTRRLQIEEKHCPQCGKGFEGVKKQRYCSRACQKKADYTRHAEEYRRARMESYHRQKAQAGKA